MNFDTTKEIRLKNWEKTIDRLEEYYSNIDSDRMAILPKREEVIDEIVKDFDNSMPIEDAVSMVTQGLEKYAVQVTNPNYYGMFNPRTSFPSILADLISAVYNPQLAAWSHAPFAVEIEHLLIQEFGKKFGYSQLDIDGVFATGGQEAHITALLCALNDHYPDYKRTGLSGASKPPTIYASQTSHHAIIKAARVCGLGSDFIRLIPVDQSERMIGSALKQQLQQDLNDGYQPLFVLATMGTTGSGAIDEINEIVKLKELTNFWLHADAAYGGGVILSSKYKYLLSGIEKSDSITFDAHKWLSVPMAASMFITRHKYALANTFSISANFMPEDENEIDRLSSYTHSIQWSRRFIGLKLYLPLLVFGWEGYDEIITKQIEVGQLLKNKLKESGWKIYNDTTMPIICFTDNQLEDDMGFSKYVYDSLIESGEAWLINYPCKGKATLRACITNYATEEKHLTKLVTSLNHKRKTYLGKE